MKTGIEKAVAAACNRWDHFSEAQPIGDNGRSFRVRVFPDDGDAFSGDVYGTFYEPRRDSNARPAQCNGAARKFVSRRGYVWWQPPADVKEQAEVAALADRVRLYLLEDWSFVGIEVELTSAPCHCCGVSKETRARLWGIESDDKTGIETAATDLLTDLLHAEGSER